MFFELSNDVQTIIIITPRHNQKKKTENKFEKNENNTLCAKAMQLLLGRQEKQQSKNVLSSKFKCSKAPSVSAAAAFSA